MGSHFPPAGPLAQPGRDKAPRRRQGRKPLYQYGRMGDRPARKGAVIKMIEVKNLVKQYGSKRAVDDISFTINKGEILGFLGPNGAGKSTTMNMITGYLSSTSGTVLIDGHDILEEPLEAKKHIGYLPELPPLYLDMTVKEYLGFVYELKKCTLPREQHLAEICRTVKIEHVYGRLIKNLSKGYKQRVGVAGALVGAPDVLILDEPTVGLDPQQIIDIRNLIKDLGKKHTVILSSHILPEVQAICERVIVINKGKLVADDTPDNLSRSLAGNTKLQARIVGPQSEVVAAVSAMDGLARVLPLGEKTDGSVEYTIEPEEGKDVRAGLFDLLSKQGWQMLGLKGSEMSLEDIFLHLIQDDAQTSKEEKSEGKKRRFSFGRKKKETDGGDEE